MNTGPASQRLRRLAGLALATMVALAMLNGVWPAFPRWPAGLAAWAAGGLLIAQVPRAQQLQVAVLAGIGIAALVWALMLGSQPPWLRLLDANVGLLAMIASVSFLRLVALPEEGAAARAPVGARAFRHTLVGVALFGSFINISAPILIADRLAVDGRLSRLASQSITRVFSACSAWSPFFGGMAVILTYVPQTRLPFVMMAGMPFALVGLVLVIALAQWRHPEAVHGFTGYPLTVAGLRVPALLALAVSAGVMAFPDRSVLLIISVAALLVAFVVASARAGVRRAGRRFVIHALDGLPGMVGELLLFIAAGVLATGLAALVDVGHVSLPITGFTAATASGLLGAILLLSAVGVHPVISVAAFTPILVPIAPDAQLLAVTYLFGWSLGTCASPLSGTHLVFQGRYGVPSLRAAMGNWPYAVVMYLVAVFVLHVVAQIRGTG